MLLPIPVKKSDLPEEKILSVNFRELYPFPSTTYGLFGIYKYPAKFIPQVVLFSLKNYASKNDVIFDPFAGQGTVGYACQLAGHNYELWDLNPILSFLHDLSTIKCLDKKEIPKALEKCKEKREVSLPSWSNLNYWYPEQFLEPLGYLHYNIKTLENESLKKLLLLAFLKTAKYFSFADEKVHKLYKSKKSKEKVQNLLQADYINLLHNHFSSEVEIVIKKIEEHLILKPKEVSFKIKTSIDAFTEDLENEVDVLITSPPYLQAQEYIRSTKLELFWLGYSENFIKGLQKKEIPYRSDIPETKIHSPTYYQIMEKIKSQEVLKIYQCYFSFLVSILEKLSKKVRKYMLIFVGNTYAEDSRVAIDQILIEHFTSLGWMHEVTYIDKVKSRVMFNTKDYRNPASGRVNKRLETEHLCVLKKDKTL